MNRKKWMIVILLLIIILALGAFYIYFINTFTAETLKRVDIQEDPLSTVSTYTLSEPEATSLFSALDTSKILSDASVPETRHVFSMALLNKWDVSMTYNVYIADANDVYLEDANSGAVRQVTDPAFFMNFSGFDATYDMRSYPKLTLLFKETSIPVGADIKSWAFQRYGGTWVDLAPLSVDEPAALETFDPNDTLKLSADKEPDIAYLIIRSKDTGESVFEGSVDLDALPLPENDGAFTYSLQLLWQESDLGYKGEAEIIFDLSADLPEVYALEKETVSQGGMILVSAAHVNDINNIRLDQNITKQFTWYQNGSNYIGYLPTNYNTAPGTYTLQFINDVTGNRIEKTIDVLPRDFKIQYLTVDPNVESSTRSDEAYAEYYTYFGPSRNVSSETRFYEDGFILPVSGRITTEFGETRYVNDMPTSYRHNGIDIAAPSGTPIQATNNGTVVLSMFLQLTGNTIVIDHGEGIFSVYLHMSTRNFETGDSITKGEIIGTVGSTGFSTGAHLHFSMYYYTTALEPGYFLYGEPITKENYKTLFD